MNNKYQNHAEILQSFLQSRRDEFLSSTQISNSFPEMSPNAIRSTLSKLYAQGIIKRNGKTYGIGEGGWFHGHDPRPRKKCKTCATIKMLYSFPHSTTSEDGRQCTCRACVKQTQIEQNQKQDLLADLLATMPATHQKPFKPQQFN